MEKIKNKIIYFINRVISKIISVEYFKSSKWLYIIWPYLALLFLHIIFISNAYQLWIIYDEFIQLGHARYFAGGGPLLFLGEIPYAHFGYVLFLLPTFCVIRSFLL